MLLIGIALPLFSTSGLMISLLCQIGIMMIFALSYNVLLGQTGLLSFGHAVYYGTGAFATMHALNFIGKGHSVLYVIALPLVGGIAALLVGILLGHVTTKKAGTTFAMISLGIGELVASSSLMFPVVFGGEAGVSGNRVIDKTGLFGVTFGPQIQVYYLIVAWVFIAAMGMFALTQTPLGRMANAVRDNPERAEFVGYDTQWVRYMMLVLSGFFAGIAGGLTALTYEIVTAETLGAHTSGAVLLMTFVGGIGFFYGPLIGAILITVMQILLGGVTQAWLLYFGLLFLFMVLRAPGGFASLLAIQRRLFNAGLLRRVAPWYLVSGIPAAVTLAGLIGLIEMTYSALSDDEGEGAVAAVSFFGHQFELNTSEPWLVAVATLVVGYVLLRLANKRLFAVWNATLATLHGDDGK
jgi:branched-chain amino acid transport system permease protein